MADHFYAECFVLFIIMLNVIMLSVVAPGLSLTESEALEGTSLR